MNCVLYARVSTDKQAEKELSIPAQLQAMKDHAQRQGWKVVAEYIEPGVSARTSERPELQRLLTLVRDGDVQIHVVLVHKIDRLARSVHDHAVIKAALQQKGIRLVSVVENVEDSISGELVENIMASIAQFYSANLAEEVKKGMRQKVIKGGWPHRPPRGYALIRPGHGKANAIEIHPKDGPLMKRAFELYATGWYSVKALALRLYKDGLTSASGGPVPSAHLRRLLASSFYAGFVHWHDLQCPGTHPPLISPDLFDKVQRVIRERFNNPGPKGSVIPGFTLRGLAICATCRGRMTAERHGRWRYYRCSRQTFRRDLCSARFCNAERAHSAIERICRQLRLDRQLSAQISEAAKMLIGKQAANITLRTRKLNEEAGNLLQTEMRLTESFAAGDMAPNVYQEQIAQLRSQRNDLLAVEQGSRVTPEHLAETVDRTLQLATSFWDLYEPMNDARRSALLKQLFEVVVLDHSGVAGFTLKPPFRELVNRRDSAEPNELAGLLIKAA